MSDQSLDEARLKVAELGTQQRILFGDEADAHAYWKDREWKIYAVDLVTGSGKRRKVIHTMYVRARDAAGAEVCAKDNDIRRTPKPFYYPRLAGPRELGCTSLNI